MSKTLTPSPKSGHQVLETGIENSTESEQSERASVDPCAGAITAIKGAFKENRGTDSFTAKKCAKVAVAGLQALTNEKGEAIEFTEDEISAFEAQFYPTVANRLAALKIIMRIHGLEPNEDFLGLLKEFFNAAAVQLKIEQKAQASKVTVKDLLD